MTVYLNYITGVAKQAAKVLGISLTASGGDKTITITRSGMGNQPNNDRVRVNIGRKPMTFAFSGTLNASDINNIYVGADCLADLVDGNGAYNYEGAETTQLWTIRNHGTQVANTPFSVRWVEPIPTYPLVGADIYRGIYRFDNRPLKQWVDAVADAGMNYIRLIVPSESWAPLPPTGTGKSLFSYNGSLFNLDAYNSTTFTALRDGIRRANKRRLILQIDLADDELFDDNNRHFMNSELYGPNNTSGYPTSDLENSYYSALAGSGNACYRTSLFNLFLEILEEVTNNNSTAIIGDGNEIPDTRLASSRYILRQGTIVTYGKRSFGGTALWIPGQTLPATNDPIFTGLAFLCLHKIDNSNYLTYYNRIAGIISAHPSLRVFFSTDGTGSGEVRGQGGRPTRPQLKQLYQNLIANIPAANLAGLGDIKMLTIDDLEDTLVYWKDNVYSEGQ